MISWERQNEYEIKALKFEKNVIVFIILLVVLVASLNILTTINITIHEKMKEIGILKALGFSDSKIINISTFNFSGDEKNGND
jgi:lipoprotein-releasing system permease protein